MEAKYAPLSCDEDANNSELAVIGLEAPAEEENRLMEIEKMEWDSVVEEVPGGIVRWYRLLTVSLILAFGTSTISLVLFLCNVQAEWKLYNLLGSHVIQIDGPAQTSAVNPELLDRANVYIGLDKLPLDVQRSTLPETLDVFPAFFQPVDISAEDYVFPDDEHARLTFNGRVSPGDKRVLLNNDVSMVAQFRIHDYGMERCRIVAAIPPVHNLPVNQPFLLGGTFAIEVWNLTTPPAPSSELNVNMLSWKTKPPRNNLLGTFAMSVNSTIKSGEFWCGPSSSLQTFELVCTSPGCHVDFFQDIYFKPRLGIYVQQSPSI